MYFFFHFQIKETIDVAVVNFCVYNIKLLLNGGFLYMKLYNYQNLPFKLYNKGINPERVPNGI